MELTQDIKFLYFPYTSIFESLNLFIPRIVGGGSVEKLDAKVNHLYFFEYG